MPVFLFDHTTNDEVRPLHTQKGRAVYIPLRTLSVPFNLVH